MEQLARSEENQESVVFWKTRDQSLNKEGELTGVKAAEGSSLARTENWPLDLATEVSSNLNPSQLVESVWGKSLSRVHACTREQMSGGRQECKRTLEVLL